MCCDESYICMCVCLSVRLSSVCRPGLVMMPSDDVDDDDDDGLTHTWKVPLGLLAMNKCSICSFECNMYACTLKRSHRMTRTNRETFKTLSLLGTIQRRLAWPHVHIIAIVCSSSSAAIVRCRVKTQARVKHPTSLASHYCHSSSPHSLVRIAIINPQVALVSAAHLKYGVTAAHFLSSIRCARVGSWLVPHFA